MRIKSLAPVPAIDGAATVIVNSEEFAVDLSEFQTGTIFFRDVPANLQVEGPLIVINPSQKTIISLQDAISRDGVQRLQIWADVTEIAELASCLKKFDDLAIVGISANEGWLKIALCGSSDLDRDVGDFVAGLLASSSLEAPKRTDRSYQGVEGKFYEETVRIALVKGLARIFKPVKPYLPKPIVHMLYRMLGAIR